MNRWTVVVIEDGNTTTRRFRHKWAAELYRQWRMLLSLHAIAAIYPTPKGRRASK